MNILVHGFNVKDPFKSVGKLASFLKNAYVFDYGWFGLLSVALYNKREAKKLKALVSSQREPCDVWAHSNGCAISVDAAKRGAHIKNLVLINPALNIDTKFPPLIDNIIVIYTKHDKATAAARFFDSIPFVGLLVINAWGAMGTRGYKGNDPRVINLNLSDKLDGHSSFFEDDNLVELVPFVKQYLI